MAHFVTRRRLLTATLLLVPVAVVVLIACGRVNKSANPNIEDVTIDGKRFHLEVALDDKVRFHGLSDRTEIAADGGMLFVFPQPVTTAFVMRDCPIDIDIIYLDGSGRIVNMYKMKAEDPRNEDEKPLDARGVNEKYEGRLKKYPSGFATQFVIELKGSTLDSLKLKKTDKIDLDIAGLKKRAK